MEDRKKLLADGDIKKVLFKLGLPATIAMMVNALYNIVDGIFVGKGVGEVAFGALTIAFPVQLLIMAIAQTIAIGGASLYSRLLGAGEHEKAEDAAGNSISSSLLIGFVFSILGLLFLDGIVKVFGATGDIAIYAENYLRIIFIGGIYSPLVVTANSLIRSEGNAIFAMKSMVLGVGLNILLDPLFIFTFGMGIEGAAYATILSQFVALVYILIYLKGDKTYIKPKLHNLKLKKDVMLEIISVGIASFVRQVGGVIVAIVLNNSLRVYGGEEALIIYGAVYKVIMFLMMPVFGVVQGFQPIAGFNYGAKKFDRVKEALIISIKTTVTFSTVVIILGFIFSNQLMGLFFEAGSPLISKSSEVFKIITFTLCFVGIPVVGSSFYQAIGKAKPALVFSLLRQIIIFIPASLILPIFITPKVLGVWIAYPISDILSIVFVSIWLAKDVKKMMERSEVAYE
ncbi:MAG: MATE family efflux transporter [Clostridia bacterium]|nr:MATE family efflux transporter [Clostridia bacterium]